MKKYALKARSSVKDNWVFMGLCTEEEKEDQEYNLSWFYRYVESEEVTENEPSED